MAGRPTNITDEVVKKLEQSLQNGFTITKACELSSISREAYYQRQKSDDIFLDKMSKAQKFAEEVARQNVVRAITKDKDLFTSRWYLERKAPNEFSTRAKISIRPDIPDEDDLSEEDVDRLSKEIAMITGAKADVNSEPNHNGPDS